MATKQPSRWERLGGTAGDYSPLIIAGAMIAVLIAFAIWR